MIHRHVWAWVALALGALLFLGGAALLYFGVLQAPKRAVIEVPCKNMVAGCLLPDQGLRIMFDQNPQPMRPFRLKVDVLNAREVHASFTMRDMQMGLNRYRLRLEGVGVWTADITLPVCMSGRGDWIMTLDVDGRLFQLPFTSY